MGFFADAGRARLGEQVRAIQAEGRASETQAQNLKVSNQQLEIGNQQLATGKIEQDRLRNQVKANEDEQTRKNRPILVSKITDILQANQLYSKAGEDMLIKSWKARGWIDNEGGVPTIRAEFLDRGFEELNDPKNAIGFASASLEEFKARQSGAQEQLNKLNADAKEKGTIAKLQGDKQYQAVLQEKETADQGVLHYKSIMSLINNSLEHDQAKELQAQKDTAALERTKVTKSATGKNAPAKLSIANALITADKTGNLKLPGALQMANQLGEMSIGQMRKKLTIELGKPNQFGRTAEPADVKDNVDALMKPFEDALNPDSSSGATLDGNTVTFEGSTYPLNEDGSVTIDGITYDLGT